MMSACKQAAMAAEVPRLPEAVADAAERGDAAAVDAWLREGGDVELLCDYISDLISASCSRRARELNFALSCAKLGP